MGMASQQQPGKRKGRPCDACVCYPKKILKASGSADAKSRTETEEESVYFRGQLYYLCDVQIP
jgi:hypothetical protein